jgi:hypothetical protein
MESSENMRETLTKGKILTPLPIVCVECHTLHTLKIDMRDYVDWKKGKHLQVAFNYLDAAERELIKTGICGECWDKLFPEEDE